MLLNEAGVFSSVLYAHSRGHMAPQIPSHEPPTDPIIRPRTDPTRGLLTDTIRGPPLIPSEESPLLTKLRSRRDPETVSYGLGGRGTLLYQMCASPISEGTAPRWSPAALSRFSKIRLFPLLSSRLQTLHKKLNLDISQYIHQTLMCTKLLCRP